MTGTCELYESKGKVVLGRCNHEGDVDHIGNVCMVITQPELTSLDTEEKYCPCKKEKDLIRTFHTLGYTEPRQDDSFVTKKCASCGSAVLLRLDEDICMYCQLRPEFYNPVNPEVYEETRLELLELRKNTFTI